MREKLVTQEMTNDLPAFSKNKNYCEIIQFYLLESPAEGSSFRGKTFAEQGWKNQKLRIMREKMLEFASASLKTNYHPCQKNELAEKMANLNSNEEYCVFLNNCGAVTSLFKAIRNAFAHGSFDVRKYKRETIYFFVNYDKYIKAKIVLKEKTLLNWIALFKTDPSIYKKRGVKQ